ncbi:MAG: DUF2231 domain-containing protein [Ilumatobacteraceae bacterium]|jgi:uncharacterized membrane protein
MFDGLLDLPVHPIVVHFPIAMLTMAWLSIIAVHAGWGDTARWQTLIGPFEWIGVVSFVPTVLTGFRDAGWFDLFTFASWSQPLIWHVVLGSTTVVVFSVHALWRRERDVIGRAVWFDVGVASVGFWGLVATGLLAGEVVYG